MTRTPASETRLKRLGLDCDEFSRPRREKQVIQNAIWTRTTALMFTTGLAVIRFVSTDVRTNTNGSVSSVNVRGRCHRGIGRVDRWAPISKMVIARLEVDEHILGSGDLGVAVQPRRGSPS